MSNTCTHYVNLHVIMRAFLKNSYLYEYIHDSCILSYIENLPVTPAK